ncbi:DNA adenine methylase [Parapedobacter defluvii]|nr:DNA adenine methylase [Parapedobacter defluvii]
MGSKREILDFVTNAIVGMDVKAEWVCDLFAGTSVVAGALKDKFNVHANDVQQYSSILCSKSDRNINVPISFSN